MNREEHRKQLKEAHEEMRARYGDLEEIDHDSEEFVVALLQLVEDSKIGRRSAESRLEFESEGDAIDHIFEGDTGIDRDEYFMNIFSRASQLLGPLGNVSMDSYQKELNKTSVRIRYTPTPEEEER